MEFEGQYLPYEEYRALGGTLDLMPFNLLEFESRRRIDIRTQNRLKGIKDIPQEVKICVYKLINSMSTYDESLSNISSNGNVASENIDGYSVSYITSAQAVEVIKSKNNEIDDIICECLTNVVVNNEHIIYLGVN